MGAVEDDAVVAGALNAKPPVEAAGCEVVNVEAPPPNDTVGLAVAAVDVGAPKEKPDVAAGAPTLNPALVEAGVFEGAGVPNDNEFAAGGAPVLLAPPPNEKGDEEGAVEVLVVAAPPPKENPVAGAVGALIEGVVVVAPNPPTLFPNIDPDGCPVAAAGAPNAEPVPNEVPVVAGAVVVVGWPPKVFPPKPDVPPDPRAVDVVEKLKGDAVAGVLDESI